MREIKITIITHTLLCLHVKSLEDAVVHFKGNNTCIRVDQTWRLATCVGWCAIPHDVLWRLHIPGRISVKQAESGAAVSALWTLKTCQDTLKPRVTTSELTFSLGRLALCRPVQRFNPPITFNRRCFRGGHLLFRYPNKCFPVTKFGDSFPQLTKLASSGLRHCRPKQNVRP